MNDPVDRPMCMRRHWYWPAAQPDNAGVWTCPGGDDRCPGGETYTAAEAGSVAGDAFAHALEYVGRRLGIAAEFPAVVWHVREPDGQAPPGILPETTLDLEHRTVVYLTGSTRSTGRTRCSQRWYRCSF